MAEGGDASGAERSPIGDALDVLLYAPVGLLVSISDEVPRLAAKGRQRLGGQMATARLVGEFAVAQGRREAAKLATQLSEASRARAGGSERQASEPAAATVASEGVVPLRPIGRARPAPRRARAAGSAPREAAPSAGHLAIPGYDSLSASQVVSRLAGLSGPELDAVREYEAGTRGRRTILTRISQLQSS